MKSTKRSFTFRPGLIQNLSTIPELPRKDFSIIKSLNSALYEEQSNKEQMVGEATYSCGNVHLEGLTMSHVPGTEGNAN